MTTSIPCKNCNYINAPGAAFCGNCGTALANIVLPPEEQTMACAFCGTHNPAGSVFCGECGLALGVKPDADEESGRRRGLFMVGLVLGLMFILASAGWLLWPRLVDSEKIVQRAAPTHGNVSTESPMASATHTPKEVESPMPVTTKVGIDIRATEFAHMMDEDATLSALEMAYPPPPVLTEVAAMEMSTEQASINFTPSAVVVTPTPQSPINQSVPTLPDEIVFQSNRDGDYEIYIMNADGTNQRQLTINATDDRYPRVSPDGRRIVYQSGSGSNTEIFVMNRDGSDLQRLTFNGELDELPAWSPDGRWIIFVTWLNANNSELFVMDADGASQQQITDTTTDEGHVSWSAAGLVFNATESGTNNYQLYRSDDDGGNRQRLTTSRIDEWSPEWSPDGSQILFLSERGSSVNSGIYIMDATTGEAWPIYNNEDRRLLEWGAVWSADGEQIVFAMDQTDGSADIFIMDADGTDVRRLTERGGYPAWAPGSN